MKKNCKFLIKVTQPNVFLELMCKDMYLKWKRNNNRRTSCSSSSGGKEEKASTVTEGLSYTLGEVITLNSLRSPTK